ncbi:uncharacterized protein LOC106140637 [Amyelois transitella]|uniref:uncharacterized protein LOC106140637 n=1 Tax=Amyelois transitella TaxID=680683 RepID=UPI00299028A6|nr:uncharacterized protein LOC106140637 [Amyelois transitella]
MADCTRYVSTVGSPFMSDMDEISFWINTKRAPCLFYIDSTSSKPESIHSVPDNIPSPKKKKRKLSILDDDSALSEKQQNLYFDASQIKNQRTNGCESSSHGSDIDFNIKKSSVQDKRKKIKLQRSARTTLHKKNKLVTSTPKPQVLRRSTRKVNNSLNNNSHLNTSFEVYHSHNYSNRTQGEKTPEANGRKNADRTSAGDQTVPRKPSQEIAQPIVANDKYEDLSDVSGFTANYIRSTKLHSKNPRKIKAKTSRNLMKESHQSPKEDSRMVICVNKSVNTGIPQGPGHNCSTDSSQNVINLVTVKNNSKSEKADKSTSLLKFVDTKNDDDTLDCTKETLDSSFSKTSRYPKRNKNIVNLVTINERPNMDRRKKANNIYNSERKENPDNVSRTRSGRNLGLSLRQKDNSVLVVNNLTDQLSSSPSVNVASPANVQSKKKRIQRKTQVRNSDNYRSRRESRDKSGFAQCFSDSDDGERKQKKYFC